MSDAPLSSETLQRSLSSVWRAEGLIRDWYTDNQANKSGNFFTNSGKSKRLHEYGNATSGPVSESCALSRKTEHAMDGDGVGGCGQPWNSGRARVLISQVGSQWRTPKSKNIKIWQISPPIRNLEENKQKRATGAGTWKREGRHQELKGGLCF